MGSLPSLTAATESYDGTTWTSVSSLNTARSSGAGAGVQTSAIAFAGFIGPPSPKTGATELWNGTSWTTSTPMTTVRSSLGGAGTQTAGLGFGGDLVSGNTNATEEFTGAFLSVKKITTS
jgi:hypothetical protein